MGLKWWNSQSSGWFQLPQADLSVYMWVRGQEWGKADDPVDKFIGPDCTPHTL